MPRLDDCHDQVVHALEKAGWDVSPSPYLLRKGNRRLYIDMYAESHQSDRRIIIVEAKCFANPNEEVNDLYTAVGQYLIYRGLLDQVGVTDSLYLANPTDAYELFAQLAIPVVTAFRIKMILVDLDREVIEQWLD
jgi:hypothetical protein